MREDRKERVAQQVFLGIALILFALFLATLGLRSARAAPGHSVPFGGIAVASDDERLGAQRRAGCGAATRFDGNQARWRAEQ